MQRKGSENRDWRGLLLGEKKAKNYAARFPLCLLGLMRETRMVSGKIGQMLESHLEHLKGVREAGLHFENEEVASILQ